MGRHRASVALRNRLLCGSLRGSHRRNSRPRRVAGREVGRLRQRGQHRPPLGDRRSGDAGFHDGWPLSGSAGPGRLRHERCLLPGWLEARRGHGGRRDCPLGDPVRESGVGRKRAVGSGARSRSRRNLPFVFGERRIRFRIGRPDGPGLGRRGVGNAGAAPRHRQ